MTVTARFPASAISLSHCRPLQRDCRKTLQSEPPPTHLVFVSVQQDLTGPVTNSGLVAVAPTELRSGEDAAERIARRWAGRTLISAAPDFPTRLELSRLLSALQTDVMRVVCSPLPHFPKVCVLFLSGLQYSELLYILWATHCK